MLTHIEPTSLYAYKSCRLFGAIMCICNVIHKTRKYITYRNDTKRGPIHGHSNLRKNLVKIGRAVAEILHADRHTNTQTQTRLSQYFSLASTPPGMPGTHPPIFWLGGRQREYLPNYYVLSDIADQYWLPYVRSASSRFHSAIRRHNIRFSQAGEQSAHKARPPTLNSR